MIQYHIIKRGHWYLHDYNEVSESVQNEPVWKFDWVDCLLFEKEYGIEVAANIKGTLFEVEDPSKRTDLSKPAKIGVMVRTFETEE